MTLWIRKMEEYVRMDAELATHLPAALTSEIMYELVGRKSVYTLADAQRVQKRQYSGPEYRRLMDLPNGYSGARMLQLLRDRARYLIERGSTLNNPHIPGSYFSGWDRITADHARRLRMLVAQALLDARAASKDEAT